MVLKFRWLESLRVPLDGGATWRGRRIFGDNKTVRGAVVMIGVSTAALPCRARPRSVLEYFDYGTPTCRCSGCCWDSDS